MASSAQQYLAFVFSDEWVCAVLWQNLDHKISLLSQSEPIEFDPKKNNDCNRAVDTALDELGDAGLSVKFALFAVPHHWTQEGDLLSEKKRFLKQLTQDLLLDPLGFVVLSDTITTGETEKTGKEFSGTLLFDSTAHWSIIVYQEGQEVASYQVGKSGDTPADHTELKSRLERDAVKGRHIYIASTTSAPNAASILEEAIGQTLEELSPKEVLQIAVTLGGREILRSQNEPSQATNQEEVATEPVEEVNPEEFTVPSFLADPTDAASSTVEEGEHTPLQTVMELSDEDRPLMSTPPAGWNDRQKFIVHKSAVERAVEEGTPGDDIEPELALIEDNMPEHKRKNLFSTLKPPHFSMPKFSGMGKKKLPLIVGGTIIALLLVSGGAYAYGSQMYTVDVDVWLKTQTLESTTDFSLAEAGNVTDASMPTLPAEIFTEEITLEKEVPTTGNKLTGDPATGEVNLLNKTSQSKTFPAGTQLKSGNLVFITEQEVQVASSSTNQDNTGTTFGTTKVKVKAVAIGPDGNLNKDTRLIVANFDSSSYEGIVTDNFSGGSSREIQAVAQKDVDTAANELKVAAKTQLQEKILASQQGDETVLDTGSMLIKAVSPSPKVGEESKFVTVSLTVQGNGVRIQSADVLENAQILLQDQVTENQQLLSETVKFELEGSQQASANATLRVKVTGQSVPQMSASQLKEQLAGQYVERGETILAENPDIVRARVQLQPSFLQFIYTTIPKQVERIHTNIRIERSL